MVRELETWEGRMKVELYVRGSAWISRSDLGEHAIASSSRDFEDVSHMASLYWPGAEIVDGREADRLARLRAERVACHVSTLIGKPGLTDEHVVRQLVMGSRVSELEARAILRAARRDCTGLEDAISAILSGHDDCAITPPAMSAEQQADVAALAIVDRFIADAEGGWWRYSPGEHRVPTRIIEALKRARQALLNASLPVRPAHPFDLDASACALSDVEQEGQRFRLHEGRPEPIDDAPSPLLAEMAEALRELLALSASDAWNGSGRLDDALQDARELTARYDAQAAQQPSGDAVDNDDGDPHATLDAIALEMDLKPDSVELCSRVRDLVIETCRTAREPMEDAPLSSPAPSLVCEACEQSALPGFVREMSCGRWVKRGVAEGYCPGRIVAREGSVQP